MSNIFGPYARFPSGAVALNTGTGPIVGGHANMHLMVDDAGAIFAVIDGVIDHYGAGLPFDADGRLVVTSAVVAYVDQGTPFSASGAVVFIDDTITYYDQGVGFTATGAFAGTGLAPAVPAPPVWLALTDQSDDEATLPQSYDLFPLVTNPPNSGSLKDWGFVGDSTGFEMDVAGQVTATTAGVGTHTLNYTVANDVDTTLSPIPHEWEITSTLYDPVVTSITATGAVTGCSNATPAGTVYTAGWTTRQFVDNDADKALIIAQTGFTWTSRQAASANPSYTADGILESSTGYYVGWVQTDEEYVPPPSFSSFDDISLWKDQSAPTVTSGHQSPDELNHAYKIVSEDALAARAQYKQISSGIGSTDTIVRTFWLKSQPRVSTSYPSFKVRFDTGGTTKNCEYGVDTETGETWVLGGNVAEDIKTFMIAGWCKVVITLVNNGTGNTRQLSYVFPAFADGSKNGTTQADAGEVTLFYGEEV